MLMQSHTWKTLIFNIRGTFEKYPNPFFPPKLMNATWANYIRWAMTPHSLHMRENFRTGMPRYFRVIPPRIQTCSKRSPDLRFHASWPNASSRNIRWYFTKILVILKIKPSTRFSQPLVIMPWAKPRSRRSTTASNMVAPQWRATHARACHPKAERWG